MIISWRSPFRLAAAMGRAFVWLCYGRPVLTPERIRLEREECCRLCEYRVSDDCGLCSCYIPAKTMLSSEQCPDKRWMRLTIREKRDDKSPDFP